MKPYIKIFIDKDYPYFLDKYLEVKTLKRLKYITQFCGCDYTRLYNPRFLFTRYDHSLVVAHMVWHFTHDKKATIAALFHDAGTPCFAHTIDLVLGDYIQQESSERSIIDIISIDIELKKMLLEDNISVEDLSNLSRYPILENKSPKLCADRLDGILHTCYVWLHTHTLKEIKEVYNDLTVLVNEDGLQEIGFMHEDIALKFVNMICVYAIELQGSTDKFVTQYISDIIKRAVMNNLITINDLYIKKEVEIIKILKNNFASWQSFCFATQVINTSKKPTNYFVSFNVKKRNAIPLIKANDGIKRIINNSEAKQIYKFISNFKDKKYTYIEDINKL